MRDINDNQPWSESDIADLKCAVGSGYTIEEAATFLCRSGAPLEVARKATELGLVWQPRSLSQDPPTIH